MAAQQKEYYLRLKISFALCLFSATKIFTSADARYLAVIATVILTLKAYRSDSGKRKLKKEVVVSKITKPFAKFTI